MQAFENADASPSGEQDTGRYLDLAGEIAALNSRVFDAKQRVAASLARALEAPAHDFGDPVFTALYEEHCRDREALFSAMRERDKAIQQRTGSGHG